MGELTKYDWGIIALVITAAVALSAIFLWPRMKQERVRHYDDPSMGQKEHVEPLHAWPRLQPVFAPVPSPADVDALAAAQKLPPLRRVSKKKATAIKTAVKKAAARKK